MTVTGNVKPLYLDHAATTPVDDFVITAMEPYWREQFGNPNSLHQVGRSARRAIEQARSDVAILLNTKPHQIIFTGGGTDADNMAIKGVAWAKRDQGRHIITTSIEHHAILHACQHLEKDGFEVTYLSVDEHAQINLEEFQNALRPDTILVSVMLGNNEVGTLQPIAEIGALLKDHNACFHTDAVQAVGHIPVDVSDLGVDLLSLSAHKFYGPKGVGALYVREDVEIEPLLHGGGQERGLRSSTENLAGIVGLGVAAKLAQEKMNTSQPRITALRNHLIEGVLKIESSNLTGHPIERLPGSASFAFDGAMGESLVLKLDMDGICASTGSACTSGHMDPSHVLLAMNLSRDMANGSLRLTLGKSTTDADIDRILEILPATVEQVRAMGF
jgi:cysteine desulfurase